MKYDDFDRTLFESFRKLPAEKLHPSVKVEVMQRIELYLGEQRRENLFSRWFLRVSEGFMAAMLILLIGFAPTLIQYARSGVSNDEARMEVAEDLYVTNKQASYFSDVEPDYSSLQTVNYR